MEKIVMGYRQCEYESGGYQNVKVKKNKLEKTIDSKVKNPGNIGKHYSKIKNKKEIYYHDFEGAYGCKCSYCGINTTINPTALFEIDHFINAKQKQLKDGRPVDHIVNLVFACRKCNQSKTDFDTKELQDVLHPDMGILPTVFERNEQYEIIISECYQDDILVNQFYKQMKFGDGFRKIDYLLLNLYHMKEREDGKEFGNIILKVYTSLLESRNRTT